MCWLAGWLAGVAVLLMPEGEMGWLKGLVGLVGREGQKGLMGIGTQGEYVI